MMNLIKPSKLETEANRSWIITSLALAMLLIGTSHLFKFIQVLINIEILQLLPLNVSPAYIAGVGLFWGLSGIYLSWSLWTGKPWTRTVAFILSIGYCMVFWAVQIWIVEPEVLLTRWPINLALTLVGLGLITFILNQKSSRRFFRKNPAKIT